MSEPIRREEMIHQAIHPPYLTADFPGMGGLIKQSLEDFQVEEIPAYEPSGTGDHLYLWVEKRDLGGEYFQRQLSRCLDIPPADVGMAGLKDRKAITRQWVSVPASCEANLKNVDDAPIRVLQTSRHTNKLKPGHLRGNRFILWIREINPAHLDSIQPIVQKIRDAGLPNFYGPQRFGHDGETANQGLDHLHGTAKRCSPFQRKLYLSAAQSLFFNLWLRQRMMDGLWQTVLLGDPLMKWPFGGMFNCTQVEIDQERFARRELVLGGPMFGKKTFAAKEVALERELLLLQQYGHSLASFRTEGKLLEGTRRHAQIYLNEFDYQVDGNALKLEFELPSGSYATVLLRELMKTDVTAEE